MTEDTYEALRGQAEAQIAALKAAYSLLLKINPADRLRFDHQDVYAACLTAIAEWECRSENEVQDEYEAANPWVDRG